MIIGGIRFFILDITYKNFILSKLELKENVMYHLKKFRDKNLLSFTLANIRYGEIFYTRLNTKTTNSYPYMWIKNDGLIINWNINRSKICKNNHIYNAKNHTGLSQFINLYNQYNPIKFIMKELKYISYTETGEIDPFIFFLEKNQTPNVIFQKLQYSFPNKKDNAVIEYIKSYGNVVSQYNINSTKVVIIHDELNENYYRFLFNIENEYFNLSVTLYGMDYKFLNEKFKFIEKDLKKFKKRTSRNKTNTSIIIKRGDDFSLSETHNNIKCDIKKNYGGDFVDINNQIIEKLNKNKKGLYLFHGDPGTGKTTYIKYLSSKIKKKFIFIPPCLTSNIDSPDFLSFLSKHKDSVLVFEDAENILLSREDDPNNFRISSLLNMTDGIVSDLLNMHVIMTFNTDKENIDSALLRKGRLSHIHEFKPLEKDIYSEYFDIDIDDDNDKPKTLADLYNLEQETGFKQKTKNPIGF